MDSIEFTADSEAKRVDTFLSDKLGQSRSYFTNLIMAGNVLMNGRVPRKSDSVKTGDVFSVILPKEEMPDITPKEIPFEIIMNTPRYAVINKPAGITVHPAPGHYGDSLVNGLLYAFGIDDEEGAFRPGIVHRLDKDTSGLLVVAKTDEAQFWLSKQFFNHTVQRQYVALIWGDPAQESGTITLNIGRDPNDRMRFKAFPQGTQGRHAVTHYRVLERFGYVTLIACRLETGRTHQIRVHFNAIGHPLFNDERYGGNKIHHGAVHAKYAAFVENCFGVMPRHALHAETLGFVHPKTKEEMLFNTPLPTDFQQVLDRWRRYVSNFRTLNAASS